jgi:hypothetical protein
VGDLSQQAVLPQDLVAHEDVARVAAALVSDLQQSSGLALSADHVLSGLDAVGHHLLAIDILAGFETQPGKRRVHPVGGGDDDAVQFLAHLFEHLLHAAELLHSQLAVGIDGSLGAGLFGGEDVADTGEADAGHSRK